MLADTSWRAIFWVSVPVGLVGTVWAALRLRDSAPRRHVSLDLAGPPAPHPSERCSRPFWATTEVAELLGPQTLAALPADQAATFTGTQFFPTVISGPFTTGLAVTFGMAAALCLAAAVAPWLRGGRYVADELAPLGDGDQAAEVDLEEAAA